MYLPTVIVAVLGFLRKAVRGSVDIVQVYNNYYS
jgi:hypothetical protein